MRHGVSSGPWGIKGINVEGIKSINVEGIKDINE
jgi:hypothetical protein